MSFYKKLAVRPELLGTMKLTVWPLWISFVKLLLVSGGDVEYHFALRIVIKYFKTRNISAMTSFLCENNDGRELLEYLKVNSNELAVMISAKTQISYQTVPPRNFSDSLEAQQYVTGVIFDLRCSSSWEVMKKISENRLMNGSFAYAFATDEPIDTFVNSLTETNIGFDSEVTVFSNNTLYDVYRITYFEPLIFTPFGRWDENEELVLASRPPRWDLQGVTLNATTVVKEFPKELILKEEFYDHHYLTSVDALARCPCKSHIYIEYLMNFKTNMIMSPDWGYYNVTTGKFHKDSMYGMLERGKVDFGLTLSWMFSLRMNTAFFAPATHHLTSGAVFRHPPVGASLDAFARPLSWSSWLVTFVFITVGGSCLIVIRLCNYPDEPPHDQRISSSLLQIAGVVCLQGSYIDSIRIPTRVLSIFLQIMSLMVYSYYGAEILGFLLSPTPRTITSVDKLLNSHMDLWAENVSFHVAHFNGHISARATKFYELAIKGPTRDKDRFIDRLIGLKMVQKGGTALYGTLNSFFEFIPKLYTSSEICSLYFMDLLYIKTATAIQKQSPYREMYYKGVQRLLESGLNDYEERNWHFHKPPCVGSEENPAVRLEATFIAQMIYATGFAMTVIFFIVEFKSPPGSFSKILRKLKPMHTLDDGTDGKAMNKKDK